MWVLIFLGCTVINVTEINWHSFESPLVLRTMICRVMYSFVTDYFLYVSENPNNVFQAF